MESWLSQWQKLRTRGEIKRAAKEIDANQKLRLILITALEKNNRPFSPEWSSKKLLRCFLEREGDAQKKSNPIHRNEVFECVHCKREVPYYQSKIRDHCPFCLRSVHVDKTPGDRAADCGALLEPVSFFIEGADIYIEYQCGKCDHQYRIRSHPEDEIPFSLDVEDLP